MGDLPAEIIVCEIPEQLNFQSEQCRKTIPSPRCSSCCNQALSLVDIDYCFFRATDDPDCCFIQFTIFNDTACEIGIMNGDQEISVIHKGDSYHRNVNTCDVNDYFIAVDRGNPSRRCMIIDLPRCSDKLIECE